MAFDPMIFTGPGLIKAGSEYLFPNPAKGAEKALNQIPGQTNKYGQPFFEAGAGALPGYREFMDHLMRNPDQLMNMLGQGYKESPGYQWNLKQGQNAIENASAAGGMAGTPQHQQMAGQLATNLASKDYGDYMDRILKMLGLGAAGTGDIVKGGQTAGSDMASRIAEYLTNKSNLQYAGQASQNKMTGDLLGGAMKLVGGFMGM